MKKLFFSIFVLCYLHSSFSQTGKNDSIAVRTKAKHLISLFEKVNQNEANIVKFGRYYHAADDITYDGYHAADYTKTLEKEYVDSLCTTIRTIIVDNDQWLYGAYKVVSPTIYHLTLKYRKSMRSPFSSKELIFIKTENDFLLIGVE